MNLFPTKTSTANGPVLPQRSSSSRPFGELTPGLGDLDLERPERLGGPAGLGDIITCKDGPLTRGVSKVKYTPILSRNIFLKKYVIPFYKATFIGKSHFIPIITPGGSCCATFHDIWLHPYASQLMASSLKSWSLVVSVPSWKSGSPQQKRSLKTNIFHLGTRGPIIDSKVPDWYGDMPSLSQ